MTDLERWVYGVAGIVGMTAIIPLAIWAMSGSLREGMYAWLQWAKIMGVLTGIGVLLGLIAYL